MQKLSLTSKAVRYKAFSSAWVVFTFLLFFGFPVTSTGAPLMHIVDIGMPVSSIVMSDKASNKTRFSANILRDYIRKSSKATLPMINVADAIKKTNKGVNIWIGPSAYVSSLKLNLKDLDEDGFIIAFPNTHNIVIIGPSSWGTEFGVYEFLERYVGVRWLFPGSDGEFIPEKSTIKVSAQEVRQEPAFFSRQLSGLPNNIQNQWARRNRMHGKVSFHHNLGKLFPQEKYRKTHPEFYPRKSWRSLFTDQKLVSWQPCFGAKGIVDEAIVNINKSFDEHPETTSYSLGVNDGGGHCKSDVSHINGNAIKNSFGYEVVSQAYYNWANAVVDGVLKKHPDKWFGLLAYKEVSEPPAKGVVHPRIVPFLTDDRMQWVDKDKKQRGQKITDRWANSSSSIGWYDYIYGSPYMVPRIYFHEMAKYYKYGLAKGVKAMYAEAYPNWGEGPKLYVALKLQWNPNLDLDDLLMDWYVSAVGEDAAIDLKAYYELWEQFWTKKITKSDWFINAGQNLPFNKPEYLNMVEFRDIEKSRELLDSVLAKVRTDKQRSRAKIIMDAFEYYEASVLSFKGLVERSLQSGRDEKYYKKFDKKRYLLVERYQSNEVLVHPVRFDEENKHMHLEW